ncbi:uroporphyrin-III C-methyltransferase [Rhodomicrobium vannielii ATCC 17100]|uniref:Siroheme synthase n=1 Tax=Rhodomicrobium vannielii (strain ATCC 17100 / DSM 162 / LMG 4299 / NCIMB 10020 / ATH 3.1.1) TaxID=648757 RepID=E3HZD6_RHOVT|nr:siroheme synthase CysG [Rhodomicrobium vannielii]ADP69882.1 uroporphyrin-III C-methyltransferase [Rhodomicrobium vannielii ATCC 17100]
MEQLPIFFQIKGKPVAVAGGGTVAARRAELALRAGGRVSVYSETLSDDFCAISLHDGFRHVARAPTLSDIQNCVLMFSATGDATADREAGQLARQAGVPVNVADAPDQCDFIMPSVVDRDPLVIAISTGGASPVFARMIRARLESVIPSAYGRLVSLVGAYRERLGAALKEPAERRRFWERVLEGRVADRFLAGHEAEARVELERALATVADSASSQQMGEVYIVGAGPGDPDLLTFRALRLMQRADVVLYDRLLPHGILNLVRREAEHIYVGKLPDDHIIPQEQITARLIDFARQGKRVLRLKGGDPFMFGRGGEEVEVLVAAGIQVQVVPGVTAATGCAAYAGIPLTHRDHAQACVFLTGHSKGDGLSLAWSALVQPRQTVVIFMGLGKLDSLMKEFVAKGGDPKLPVAIVDNGTRPNQRVVTGTVETIARLAAQAELQGPAIIILGTVVTLRDKLATETAPGAAGSFANKAGLSSIQSPV